MAAAAALAALAWWWRASVPPEDRAGRLLRDNPALVLPSRPRGLVVLARPGRWARLLARHPARRPLLDPAWWRGLAGGNPDPGTRIAAPGAAAVLLDRFPRGLVGAWWDRGWVVQGAVTGEAAARRISAVLPPRLAANWAVRDGILVVASGPGLLRDGRWRPPPPRVDPDRNIACWIRRGETEWTGHWEGRSLVLERGSPPPGGAARPRGTLLARFSDAERTLARLGLVPRRGEAGAGMGGTLGSLLGRPVTLWVQRIPEGNSLPTPQGAARFARREGETPGRVEELLGGLLCAFGCVSETAELLDGTPVSLWRSAVGRWWVLAGEGGVAVADTRDRLEAFLGMERAGLFPAGTWVVTEGPSLGASLRALGGAAVLADLGLVDRTRLQRAARLAGPLAGFGVLSWVGSGGGGRVEIELAAPPGGR